MGAWKVGVVGCGNIVQAYLDTLPHHSGLELTHAFDLDRSRAEAVAAKSGAVVAGSLDELLRSPIDCVLNLTVPSAHFEIAHNALLAGKHVYNEKPLALDFSQAKSLCETAESKGLLLGCAPDTVLGPGVQSCRRLIDAGRIGTVTSGAAAMMCAGHESWHPDPAFYYKPGGGPVFDMGPYYISALVTLLGPVRRVIGIATGAKTERVVGSGPHKGERIGVEVPTHVAGLLEFHNGAIVQMTMSFDVAAHSLPHIELYGNEGSIRVPDPNGFGGAAIVGDKDGWNEAPTTAPLPGEARGLGLADLAANGLDHRATGRLALHVVEIMEALHSGTVVQVTTCPQRPPAMGASV